MHISPSGSYETSCIGSAGSRGSSTVSFWLAPLHPMMRATRSLESECRMTRKIIGYGHAEIKPCAVVAKSYRVRGITA